MKRHNLNITSLFLFIFIAFSTISFGQLQEDLNSFNTDRLKKNKTLMMTLGGWSIANITTGTIGTFTTENSSKHFHQMNALWNTVNFSLAAGGLLRHRIDKKKTFNLSETIKEQHKTEKIFLVNSALDISYIGAGAFLNYRSSLGGENAYLQKGFGNSLIVQGAFLLLFDVAAFYIHKKNRLKKLEPIIKSIGL